MPACFLSFLVSPSTGKTENPDTMVKKIFFLNKAMAPHSSTLAWKMSWMEEPGRLQSMGSQRVGHD